MQHGHFEMIRLTINRFIGDSDHMFGRWRVNAPFKPVTKKGQGQRMGGGKGTSQRDNSYFPHMILARFSQVLNSLTSRMVLNLRLS